MSVENELAGSSVLVVEDEESMATGLVYNLEEEGYRVLLAKDGAEALELYRDGSFDLAILDVMLPYHDGFEIARVIRAASPQLPILFLTAISAQQSKIRGLTVGADDYLTKPFHLQELLLRVRRMLKRGRWYTREELYDGTLEFGDNSVDFATLTAQSGEQRFTLTPREAGLLKYLWQQKGRIVPRSELLRSVWDEERTTDTRTVDNFVMRLRKYFEPDPSRPCYFLSVRGAGYRFLTGKDASSAEEPGAGTESGED
ncbi:MAG TPA: response regulator transcription factor [Spirochaetia bacterium]|nr:response regulator transcription factor [Spirochaetia bacterium]